MVRLKEASDWFQEISTSTLGSILERPITAGIKRFLSWLIGKAPTSITDRTVAMEAGISPMDMNAFYQALINANLPRDKRKALLLELANKTPREKQNVFVLDTVRTSKDQSDPVIAGNILKLHADMDSEEFQAIKTIGDLDKPASHRLWASKLESELHQHLDPVTDWLRTRNERREVRLSLSQKLIPFRGKRR